MLIDHHKLLVDECLTDVGRKRRGALRRSAERRPNACRNGRTRYDLWNSQQEEL